MASRLEFGMFDWVDAGPGSLAELYEARLRLIEAADRAGFYGYHIAEHHGTPLGMAPSPAILLAAVAQRTRRIRFGPMAFLMPLYHPLRLIEEVCMLDHLSGGRVEVGVSRGVSPYEIRCFGIDPEETRAIFNEAMAVYRAGMSEEVLEFEGAHFSFHDVPMEIKPLQRPYPPLWYPSFSESGVTYAAEQGYNFMSIGPPKLVAELMTRYRDVAAAHAGEPGRLNGHVTKPMLGAMRQVYVGESDATARAEAEPAYAAWYDSITRLWHRHGDTSYDAFFEFESCVENESVLIGSAETVRDRIGELVDASGIDYFVGSFAWGALTPEQSQRSLARFTESVMPAFGHAAGDERN